MNGDSSVPGSPGRRSPERVPAPRGRRARRLAVAGSMLALAIAGTTSAAVRPLGSVAAGPGAAATGDYASVGAGGVGCTRDHRDLTVPAAAAPHPVVVPILMYHMVRINLNHADRLGGALSVTPRDFETQMAWLQGQDAHPVTVSDVVAASQGRALLPPRAVAITFDDGFEDFWTAAMPILLRHGLFATVFAVPGFAAAPNHLSAAQLRALAGFGMVVGAHTVHHADLTHVPLPLATLEIAASRTMLQQMTGTPVVDFAYPFGDHNAVVDLAVAAAGFTDAVTTNGGDVHAPGDRFGLTRVRVGGGEPMSRFIPSVTLAGPAVDTSTTEATCAIRLGVEAH